MSFDLTSPRSVHVLGASGPGMGAIARVLARMGHHVSACDVRDTPALRGLASDGVVVSVGNAIVHLDGVEAITYSSVIPDSHPEIVAARERGAYALIRADMLAAICATRLTVAVAGTHGKTTTSAMLATILVECGQDPGYVIGGDVPALGSNAHWGSGKYLVVEADESDSTHVQLPVFGAILTSIDVDHLDNFGSFEGIVASFTQFVRGVPGPRVLCAEDAACAALAHEVGAITYGINCGDVQAVDMQLFETHCAFDVHIGNEILPATLHQRGRHNVLNALAAVTMATCLGVPASEAVSALRRFSGVSRRFEVRGEIDGIRFVDDYAHLPAEISASLAAARVGQIAASRVVAVFQPNRFHRIEQMATAYAECFTDADLVVITDIYASGTTPIAGVTGQLIVDAVRRAHPNANVEWCASRDALGAFVGNLLRSGDVCVSMGCGDIASLPDEIMTYRAVAR